MDPDKIYQIEQIKERARLDEKEKRETTHTQKKEAAEKHKKLLLTALVVGTIMVGYYVFFT